MKLHSVFSRSAKSVVCAALIAGLACGCAVPSSGASSASSSAPGDAAAASAMEDGALRILYSGGDTGAALVFHGTNLVCSVPEHGTVTMVTDFATGEDRLFLVTEPEGSDKTRRTLYNADGTVAFELDELDLSALYGDWILVGQPGERYYYSYDGGCSDCRFINLRTGEQRPGPDLIAASGRAGNQLYLLYCEGPEDNPRFTTVFLDSDLQETTRFEDTAAYNFSWQDKYNDYLIVITSPSADAGGYWFDSTEAAVYNCRTGQTIPGYEFSGSMDTICALTDSGQHAVYRLSDGKMLGVYEEACVDYLDAELPLAAYWKDGFLCLQVGDGDPTPMQAIACGENDSRELAALTEEETPQLLIYGADGQLLSQTTPALHSSEYFNYSVYLSQPADGLTLLSESGYASADDYSQTRRCITLYKSDGTILLQSDNSDYQNLYGLEGTDLLYAFRYGPGGTAVYDLLDKNGKLVVSGLGSISGTRNGDIIPVRKGFEYGWMDTSGNWLWHTGIFSNIAVDHNRFLY